MVDFLEGVLGGVGGVGGLIGLLAFVSGVWPKTWTLLSTWMYSHIDPSRLPYGSEANRHWAQQRKIAETQHEIQDALRETQRDIIKNTILQLIRDQNEDHTSEVAYELSKLEALESRCWVMDVARDYITNRTEKED